jgi:hypothetical protein
MRQAPHVCHSAAIATVSLLLAMTPATAQDNPFDYQPPRRADGGVSGLKAKLLERDPYALTVGVIDSVKFDQTHALVLVGHNPYSGISAIHPYLYVCGPSMCERLVGSEIGLGAPRGVPPPGIKLFLSKDKRSVEIRTPDGVAHIRIRLPKPDR